MMRDYKVVFTFTGATPEELARQVKEAKALVDGFAVAYGRDGFGWWCSSTASARQRSGLGFYELVEEVQAAYDAACDVAELEAADELEDA
ncbi:hypothetical protein P7L87_26780 [Vibrio parahaemolyticus]|nr:hypothetical protein [Vibrio parahaemolyticus]